MNTLFRSAVLTVLSLLLAMSALSAAQEPAKAAPEVTVIRAGSLIDGSSNEARRDQVIVVRGNRIEAVRSAAGFTAPAGAHIIDLSGKTVLPGMIDTHTHIFLQGEDPAEGGYDVQLLKYPIAYRAARAVVAARRALEQGFTSIRDVETEGAGYGDIGIKQAITEGHIPGPRIFASTRGISSTGGYNLEGYAPEIEVPKGVQIVDGPYEARKAAREQLDHGADWLKVYMTHRSWLDAGGNLVTQPTLTVEELKAIVDEAHGWGKKVACHAYNGTGLQRALDGGCDSLEHGLELTDANIQQMLKQGTWYVPTMTVYYGDWAAADTAAGKRDRKRVELHGISLKKAHDAGVKIAFGTDVGGFSWMLPIAKEFDYLTQFGFTPAAALKTATVNAAELLGMKGEIGVIAPGAYADIIAVDADPLRDVQTLKNVTFVMKDGKVFKGQ